MVDESEKGQYTTTRVEYRRPGVKSPNRAKAGRVKERGKRCSPRSMGKKREKKISGAKFSARSPKMAVFGAIDCQDQKNPRQGTVTLVPVRTPVATKLARIKKIPVRGL